MDEILQNVLRIIYASGRKMPAYFTSDDDNDRQKTFCLDYDISPDDEYEMASVAYNSLGEMILAGQVDIGEQYAVYVKPGEDIMIGSYILAKQNKEELINELKTEIINNAVEDFGKSIDNYKKIISNPWIEKYLNHCAEFGVLRSKG